MRVIHPIDDGERLQIPGVEEPGRNTTLWRYMSLSKLLQMLQSRTIWFSRVDQLIQADPYEGSLPFGLIADETGRPLERDAEIERKHQMAPGSMARSRQLFRETFKSQRSKTFVSCWHSGSSDNDAMWRLYGAEKDGSVCVKSTMAALAPQIPKWVSFGRVKYVSYDERWPDAANSYVPFFRKRTCFEHEREVRMLFNSSLDDIPANLPRENKGHAVPFDPELAFSTIFISPTAPPWFEDVVQSSIQQFRMKIDVEPAPMARKPAF